MFRRLTRIVALVALVALPATPSVEAGLPPSREALQRTAVASAEAGPTGSAAAQEKKPVSVADFAGTWNIEVMSHQIALVIEAAEGNKVTATMMMMGTDVPLKGELVDKTLTLVGVKPEGAEPATGPSHVANQKPGAKPITATLQDDGTLVGEMMTNGGPVTWTGEKLKKKKS